MKAGATIAEARILLVDDEPANVRVLEMMLNDDGYMNLKSASDGMTALAAFEDFKPDIVLLDLHMPVIDGFEVLRRLREGVRPEDHTPIVVLTADATPATKLRAFTAGASDFVTKPFEEMEVLVRVKNLLTSRHARFQIKHQNQILEEKVQERTAELQAAQLETLERLALAGEYRDDDTGKHTQRVGCNAANLSEALHLDPEYVDLIRRAAPLHDIGKIGVSDLILLKPGKLTPEEFEKMKAHTTIGAQMLSGGNTPLIQLAEDIARSHHERWDGNGYPNRLAGDQISLAGRIVSVCDVFDALTHERPYKQAWTVEDALREIASKSGTQFDPEVVAAFKALIESGKVEV
ncbi:two-component system response regulator [soil metagenome]